MTWLRLSEGKSGKREVAVALLMLWAFITSYIFFWIPAETISFYRDIFGTVTLAVIGFAGGAFGFDAYLKNRGGPAPDYQPPPRRRHGADGPGDPPQGPL